MSTLALELAPARWRGGALTAFWVACVLGGTLVIAGLAQVSIPLPFTPVPITGQTLGVLLVGAAYGPGLGASTLAVYLLAGALGLPVFAPNADGSHETGFAVLAFAGATGGYLWGFVAASTLVGWLSQRGWDRSFRSSVGAMFLGSAVIYLFGVPWLMAAIDVGLEDGLAFGMYPFIIGDALKLLAAAALLPGAWRLLRGLRPDAEA